MKKQIYINHASHLCFEQISLFSGIPLVDFEQVNTSWIDTMEICYFLQRIWDGKQDSSYLSHFNCLRHISVNLK